MKERIPTTPTDLCRAWNGRAKGGKPDATTGPGETRRRADAAAVSSGGRRGGDRAGAIWCERVAQAGHGAVAAGIIQPTVATVVSRGAGSLAADSALVAVCEHGPAHVRADGAGLYAPHGRAGPPRVRGLARRPAESGGGRQPGGRAGHRLGLFRWTGPVARQTRSG